MLLLRYYGMAFNKGHGEEKDLKSDSRPNIKRKRENERQFWLDTISKGKTAEELIPLIVSEIEATATYYMHVNDICWHLDKIMKFFYKDLDIKILPFGSADTKLAFRDSDVDIFLDFKGNLPESPKKLLKSLKNKVRKFGYFNKTFAISARTPIIQCVHCSGLSCDLSFLNSSAVSNSQLIKFLLSLDVRLRTLVMLLKYLLKTHGLIGPHALTSYALVILILFFLQSLQSPIIPSINYLQSSRAEPEIIADWDMSFSIDINCLQAVKNHLSVLDLLHKFFEFYATFEFGFYVISVYTGKYYLKTVFSDSDLWPEEFHLYKKNLTEGKCDKFEYKRFMCVQDPFIHSFNVTRNTTQKSLIQFQQLCSRKASRGQELYGDGSQEKKLEYLRSLFDHIPHEPKSKKMMLIEPVLCFVGQEICTDDPNCTEDDLRKKWSEDALKSLTDILTKVMKCEFEMQNKEAEGASTSYEDQEKIINCELKYFELVTKKRNEVRNEFKFPKEMPVINQEEMISNHLCDTILKDAPKISLKFGISCNIQKGPTCLCVNFDSKEQTKSDAQMLQQVFKFLQNSFKWIK